MTIDRRVMVTMLGSAAFVVAAGTAKSTSRPNLYVCEGCESVGEVRPGSLKSIVQIAPPDEPGERLILKGKVVTADGSKPAPGVVIYAHHTNNQGYYANGTPETEWSRRHGRLRAWAITSVDGDYEFRTIKPAPYPDRTMPAHIHLHIGEPGRRPYYIDDVVFEGEFGVTPAYVEKQEFRGGSGIVRLQRGPGGVLLAVRDIRLERHPA